MFRTIIVWRRNIITLKNLHVWQGEKFIILRFQIWRFQRVGIFWSDEVIWQIIPDGHNATIKEKLPGVFFDNRETNFQWMTS